MDSSIMSNVVGSCETRVAKVLLSLDKPVRIAGSNSSGNGSPRGMLRQYCPQELLSGCVTVQLEYKQFLRGVWVKLSGANIVLNQTIDGVKKKIIADVLSDEPDHYCGGLHQVLLGLGEEPSTEVNYNDLLELEAGCHVFPFSIAIPSKAPLTYCDENCALAYSLDAVLDSPAVSNASSTVSVAVVMGGVSNELYNEIVAPCVLGAPSSTGHGDSEVHFTSSDRKRISSTYNFLRRALGYPSAHAAIECLSGPCVYDFKSSGGFSYIKMKYRVCNYSFVKDIVVRTELVSRVSLYRRRKINDAVHLSEVGSYMYKIFSEDRVINKHTSESSTCLSVDIPVKFDTAQRLVCLSEWPRPAPLSHEGTDGYINHYTASGPLFNYKILVQVSFFKKRNNNLRGASPASVFSALGLIGTPLVMVGEPFVKEVFIRPPQLDTQPLNSVVSITPRLAATTTSVRPPLVPAAAACCRTPHARIAVPRVAAEPLSLGPAAVLMDRQNSSTGAFRTPSRFATMYRLVQDAAVAYAIAPNAAETPQYSPAMASVYVEEDAQTCIESNRRGSVPLGEACSSAADGAANFIPDPTPLTVHRNRIINASNTGGDADCSLGNRVTFHNSAYVSDDDEGNDENDRLAVNTSGSYRVWQTPTHIIGLGSSGSLGISTEGGGDAALHDDDAAHALCSGGGEGGGQVRMTSPVYGAASIATQLFR